MWKKIKVLKINEIEKSNTDIWAENMMGNSFSSFWAIATCFNEDEEEAFVVLSCNVSNKSL